MIGRRIASHWSGQTALLPTLHGKGRALGAALGPALGIAVEEVSIDTDRFGSFSGSIPRPDGALAALSAKVAACREARPDARIVIASEGSFGPHPAMPWLAVNIEYLRWHELDEDFELTVSSASLRPMHRTHTLSRLEELETALPAFGFPAHGLMVAAPGAAVAHSTGITTVGALCEVLASTLASHGAAELRSDLRAHLNPTRMRHITRAAWRLANRLRTACPDCGAPGFGEAVAVRGLPCVACGFPTSEPAGRRWRCLRCPYTCERVRTGFADALRCPLCNP
ncbi:hypothetical protein GCM10025771_10590 [Niveibacterium umoris]|uniref:DUF6671 domain-containing protein n=1 Tax=Niveibacterium umoris TaxID=1193620 RepID=A0A840BK97_9RHOO|nr:DUF6671 family protein [Niveibacterium umoris]MBB4013390.1 hypothetical protein [Niveibacterium umoris]